MRRKKVEALVADWNGSAQMEWNKEVVALIAAQRRLQGLMEAYFDYVNIQLENIQTDIDRIKDLNVTLRDES
jgi:hypothetical protein